MWFNNVIYDIASNINRPLMLEFRGINDFRLLNSDSYRLSHPSLVNVELLKCWMSFENKT